MFDFLLITAMFESSFLPLLKQNYNFSHPVMGAPLGGLNSQNYQVYDQNKNYVVKCLINKKAEEVDRLIEVWDFLYQEGIPVPKLVKSLEHKASTKYENINFIVYEKQKGNCFHEADLTETPLKNVAKLLGGFHKLSKKCSLRLPNTQEIVRAREQENTPLSNFPFFNPEIPGEAQKILQKSLNVKQALIDKIGLNSDEFIRKKRTDLVHGDFHNENILFKANGEIDAVLDYENVYLGDGLFDVLHFIRLGCCNTGYKDYNLQSARVFAKEYLSINPRSYEDVLLNTQFYLTQYTNSIFLEKSFLLKKDLFYLELIKRDIGSFNFFLSNLDSFVERTFGW